MGTKRRPSARALLSEHLKIAGKLADKELPVEVVLESALRAYLSGTNVTHKILRDYAYKRMSEERAHKILDTIPRFSRRGLLLKLDDPSVDMPAPLANQLANANILYLFELASFTPKHLTKLKLTPAEIRTCARVLMSFGMGLGVPFTGQTLLAILRLTN
ncbi:MAG: hypothetical protein WCV84_04015 [Patescibacteria group bacterium]